MIRQFLRWLWTPSTAIPPISPPDDAVDGVGFTRAEWRRPHGHIEEVPGVGRRRWNAHCMYWQVLDRFGNVIGTICPDHERRTEEYREELMQMVERIAGHRLPRL